MFLSSGFSSGFHALPIFQSDFYIAGKNLMLENHYVRLSQIDWST